MKVEAISAFTAFTGEMKVFNKGDVGDLPDDVAAQYVEAGLAKKSSKKVTEAEAGPDAPNPVDEAPAADETPADGASEDEAPAA